jgi:hypothetical protein
MVYKPHQRGTHLCNGFFARQRLQIPDSNRQVLAVMKVRCRRRTGLKPTNNLLDLLLRFVKSRHRSPPKINTEMDK